MRKQLLTIFFLFFSFSFVLLSCNQQDIDTELDNAPSTTPVFGPNFRFYTDSNLFLKEQAKRTSSQSDIFSIDKVRRENDLLFVDISYSGGCKAHEFDIIWDGVVNLSHPGKVNILLKHNANGDQCEAMVKDVVEIDLNKYFNNMIDSDNTIILVSNGSSIQEISSVDVALLN